MLNKAIKKASQLENKKQRVFAIITDKKGHILASGGNSYTRTHPRMAYYSAKFNDFNKIYLHAEIASIVACNKKPYAIYIARVDKKGNSLPCNPCPICKLAILDAGITKIITT